MEKEEEDLLSKEKYKAKKKIIMIFLTIIGLILTVVAIIAIIFILQEKYDDENKETKYELALNKTELEYRTNPEHLGYIYLLKKDSQEYINLSDGDKKALKHLIKAAQILEEIELRIDNIHNIPFKKFLESELKNKSTEANLTKIIFDSQKGINAFDSKSNIVNLAKNHSLPLGMGVYPEDLTEDKFKEIIYNMLNENKIDEVKKILNQRSIVEWDKDKKYLKSTDYIEYFKDNFTKISEELIAAANVSSNNDFNEYLKLQAEALLEANSTLDALADKKWSELQDTNLEITLVRENYNDRMTVSLYKNETIKNLLISKGIYPTPKDCLGLRVGIINKEETNNILKIKQHISSLEQYIPHNSEYTKKNIAQTMVDVDLVILAGVIGAYRGQISLAESLPNDDKLSFTLGGGKRTVYHKQIRLAKNVINEERLKEILDNDQIINYDTDASHWFTIGHKVAYGLGPDTTKSTLGEYKNIMEEIKGDMASLVFVDHLKELELYNEDKATKIKITAIIDLFMANKPDLSQIYKVSKVIESKYLYIKGVYSLNNETKIHINVDKVNEAALDLLDKIIKIQMNNNINEAKEFCDEYFKWEEPLVNISEKLEKYDKEIHCVIKNELADDLLNDNQ